MNFRICFLPIIFLVISNNFFSQSYDAEQVQNVIVNSYIQGLINAKDFEKAKEGIHEDFVILGHNDNLLTKKTRDEWIIQRSKRKNLPEVDYSIVFIDIEKDAASAKIKMTRGNIIATDYVFLYKFDNGWKIVSAIDQIEKTNKE